MRIFGLMVVTALLSACGGKQVPQDKLSKDPPLNEGPAFSLDQVPDMEFEQSIRREYDLLAGAHVKNGNPVLELKGMPEGSTFDGRIFSWAPSCDLGDEFFGRAKRTSDDFRTGKVEMIAHLTSDDGSPHYIERVIRIYVYEFEEYSDRPCKDAP